MNARELFAALDGVPGTRRLRVEADGIVEALLLPGVEVARAASADDRALRRAWRARSGGGPDPLLVVTDEPDAEGVVRALGPLRADGPIRVVGADQLLGVLRRLPALSRLEAVRTLAEELERLDRGTVAGLVVRGLGTDHFYRERLPSSPRWAELAGLAEGLQGDWRELLQGLGYELDRLPARGYLARHNGRPVLVVWPLADPAAFSRLDPEGRPPEGVLVNECLRYGARYGVLASGARLRLLEASPQSGSAVGRYLELDASALGPEDRPLLGLFSPAYLADGGLEAALAEARDFGAGLRRRLDQAVRQRVLPGLALDLGRWARTQGWDLASDERRRELEAACLTFVFRVLFLLYAESSGYLPMSQEAYRRSSLSQIVRDAHEQEHRLDGRSTAFWDRLLVLVRAMRTGNDALAVPAYDGDLFAADGLEGADLLERASLSDAAVGPALVALGIDPETGSGFDYSGLEIGHLGNIYEGLLSLRLAVADRDLRYDPRADRYVTADPGSAEVRAGELLWLTDEGGRKGGGVYYTPEPLVRHLVRRGVRPAFERHLEQVAELARTDPEAAARRLFCFRVLDPACGSAHFLVACVDEVADLAARFLAEHPLPQVRRELDDLRAPAGPTYGIGIEDATLLRRLVLRRCVYGVDLSPMGAEIAKLSLWLASFVPGLSLAYLDHNVKVGNSLVGVASAEDLLDASGASSIPALLVAQAVEDGASAASALYGLMDRTPEEVARSEAADREARRRVEHADALLDLWVAEPLGLAGARAELWAAAEAIGHGEYPAIVKPARELADARRAFHWPLEFPEVFADRKGFDAVVGNPPWEEVTVEELAFYARYQPGLRALPERERQRALEKLKRERSELPEKLEAEQAEAAVLRAYFGGGGGYEGSPGDPDLYKFFCQRYRRLLAPGGVLAVVLPRSAFSAKGSTDFRRWLFERTTVERLDFLLNNRYWMFDTHPQYTVALVVAEAQAPAPDHAPEVAGVAESAERFRAQSEGEGIRLAPEALGPLLEVPLLLSQAAADLLAKLRTGPPFPFGCGRWRCFPVAEFHETHDRALWEAKREGRPLWKGESFDQFDPHGAEERLCPASEAALAKACKSRPGAESLVAAGLPLADRRAAQQAELERARVAFRDVSRATDSRTIRAALVPAKVFLTNTAPYLVFPDGSDLDRACCLGLLNSLAFDWQARRFVETHVNFFILEGLRLPTLSDEAYEAIARAAARLSCADERFAAFAEACGVEYGPLDPAERERLRVEIDAWVARAWNLDDEELELVLSDFTLDAVPESYRERLRRRLAELR